MQQGLANFSPGRHLRTLRPWVLLALGLLLHVQIAPAQNLPAPPAWDYPIFDFLLTTTERPELLGPRRQLRRQVLLRAGVDPASHQVPTLNSQLQARFARSVDWEPWRPLRTKRVLEVELDLGLIAVYDFPRTEPFFTIPDTNLVGVGFVPAREFERPEVRVSAWSIDEYLRGQAAPARNDQWRRQLTQRKRSQNNNGELLNFTLPIKLPRTLERLIGRGEATNIRISGQETIQISGESTVQDRFLGSEIRQSQSLFPTLEMRQTLRVSLDGTVGEKIKVRVTHDSQAFGSNATQVRLAFEGDEDDIIQVIRAGNIDITLPGSRLVGVGATKGGLFGIKVEGAMGPVDFTVVTSKEQSQENNQNFNSSGGSEEEFRIRSTDYIKNRFFRLVAPTPLFFVGNDSTPPLRDQSGPLLFGSGLSIDFQSFELYLSDSGAGIDDENTINFAYAFLDTTGIGWEDGDPNTADFDPTTFEEQSGEYARRWKRLQLGREYNALLDVNGELIGIVMERSVQDGEVLACSYDIVNDAGAIVRRVGRNPGASDALIPNPNPQDPPADDLVHFFKLIKPRYASTPLYQAGTGWRDFALTWEYVYRHYYDLRGRGIDPGSIELEIERVADTSALPELDARENIDPPLPWFQAFGLDQQDNNSNLPPRDGIPDYSDAAVFSLESGILQFRSFTPFNPSAAELESFSGISGYSLPNGESATGLYTRLLQPGTIELSQQHFFDIVVKHSSTSSRFRLNAFNVKEGSEEVRLDGRILTRGTDYNIDYFSGEINLIDQPLNAQSNIDVSFEVDPLFGGGRTSLHGFNLGYSIDPIKTLSTTWLLQSKPNNATKPRLGEEPSRNLVGNFAAKLQFRPSILRKLTNLLPLVDTTEDGNVRFDGEMAVSVPNPNTKGQGYVEDFESVDESVTISLSRDGWAHASLPAVPDTLARGTSTGRRFDPGDRAYAGWHRAVPGVLRGDLNPDLSEQEKRDVLPAMELRMESNLPDQWGQDEYSGIMRGLGDADLSRSQFLEFWVNDFTGDVDPASREGTLHFDFGLINEDSFWPVASIGDSNNSVHDNYVLRTFQDEDEDNDGLLNISEDIGLDGRSSNGENGTPIETTVLWPQRPGLVIDPAGDDFSSDPNLNAPEGEENVFLYINGTEGNQRLDSEDLNRDRVPEWRDGYYSISLDLSDTTQALVDVYRDYAGREFLEEQRIRGSAWRKYRIDLRQLQEYVGGGDSAPYDLGTPDLTRVRTFRIWYENPDGIERDRVKKLVFADMRFLGNRWIADGLRDSTMLVLDPATRGEEDFRVGVLNNKENPDYVPPVFVDRRNSIEEKEQSLQLSYNELEPGHQFRVYKEVPGSTGQDFTPYEVLDFYWRLPYEGSFRTTAHDSLLTAFYWVGSDSNNYYEIGVKFDEVETDGSGWQRCVVPLGELTNVKFAEEDTVNVNGRDIIERRGIVYDAETAEPYHITVRGRPDLRRVRRFYAGLRYRGGSGLPISGNVLFNEIRLDKIDRTVGYATRISLNTNLPGLGDIGLEFNRTDPQFRGLNRNVGSRVLRTDVSARINSRLQSIIPLWGYDVPVNMNWRQSEVLPDFRTSSDIQLLDDIARQGEKTLDISKGFNYQIRRSPKGKPSGWTSYSLDRLSFAHSLSETKQLNPTQTRRRVSESRKTNFDLQFPREANIGLPILGWKLRFIPNQFTASANWSRDLQDTRNLADIGGGERAITRQLKTTTNTLGENASLVWNPFNGFNANASISNQRNLAREDLDEDGAPRKGTYPILGFDRGVLETFNQRLSMSWRPQVRWLNWMKPDMEYSATYGENRRPGIRKRAGDGFEGVAGRVRHLNNDSDFSIRTQVNPLSWVQKRLTAWDQRRNQREQERAREAGRQRAQREQADSGTMPGAATDSTQSDDLAEMARLAREQADVRREENALARAEADSGDGGGLSRPSLRPLFAPFLNLVKNLQPISANFSRQDQATYTHAAEGASAAFRFGFSRVPGVDEKVLETDDEFYSTSNLQRSDRISLSTESRLSENIRMDLSYSETQRQREGTNGRNRDYTIDWPNATVNIQGVQNWRIFGSLFSSSNLVVVAKRTKSATGVTIRGENPRRSMTLGPRWNFRFKNGLDANVTMNLRRERSQTTTSAQHSRTVATNLKVQKNFDADGALSFLRFGRRGTGSTIDMTVDLSYDRNTREREVFRTGETDQQGGSTRLGLRPNFSYQFSRNLRAGLNVGYSRNFNINQDITTQSFSVGMNATLNF